MPRGLLALCVLVAVLVAAPVVVTIVQAFSGGFSAASTAFGAHAIKTGVRRSLEVAAVATPIAVVIGVACAWLVERTHECTDRQPQPRE